MDNQRKIIIAICVVMDIQRTDKESFLSCVRKEFGFLESEFGYTLSERLIGFDPWSDGVIEFFSYSTSITIGKDRNDFWVLIRPQFEPEIAAQPLQTIVESLSLMQGDQLPPGTVAPAQYPIILGSYAQVLRKYCIPFIRGDFSLWNKVLEFHLDQMRRTFGKRVPPEFYSELESYINSRQTRGNGTFPT